MKIKINLLTKIVILIFITSLFIFTSCETEEIIIEQTIKSQNYSVGRVKLSEYESNTKLIEKLSEIDSFATVNKGISSRSNSNEQVYNLNTEEAIYIENSDNTQHSYTFSIDSQEGLHNLQNIVLSSLEDGSYKAYLSTYAFTQQERLDFNNGIYLDLTDISFIQEIDYSQVNLFNRSGCVYELMTIEVNNQCNYVYPNGHQCDYSGHSTTEYINIWVEVCGGSGSGGSSDGGSGSGNGGSGPSGGSEENTY